MAIVPGALFGSALSGNPAVRAVLWPGAALGTLGGVPVWGTRNPQGAS
ncbi:hypothetical protein JK358_13165 [Nocardia sp. 2]|uniref:Uncharacterized protein n=1 Tax=Nocardia acididurans TaxID=2802282 RepID=A0ABS1M479_9NOCA|nr:hypothetical protein [Nocardia acididurans]MBL1075344.1 hypothetical protein [Nocardia acididurans]